VALEYKLRDNGGEPATCDCCGFPAPTAQFDWGPPATAKHDRTCRLLCEFCSTTMASRYNEYPQGDEFGLLRGEMWRAAACVFNAMRFGFALDDEPTGSWEEEIAKSVAIRPLLDVARGVNIHEGVRLACAKLADQIRGHGMAAPQEARYLCIKCGYSGPLQVGHQRPNGTGECGYIAARVREVVGDTHDD
jgi:predicted RNA-binding Zn-ribbon protein involved in translation (DUF1610 family)